jgi:hypothetical protein
LGMVMGIMTTQQPMNPLLDNSSRNSSSNKTKDQ